MKAHFEIGKELGELRARVAALEAHGGGCGGDGATRRRLPALPTCDALRDAIAALDASIEALQEQLAQPPAKPGLAGLIVKQERARDALQRQLDSLGGCV